MMRTSMFRCDPFCGLWAIVCLHCLALQTASADSYAIRAGTASDLLSGLAKDDRLLRAWETGPSLLFHVDSVDSDPSSLADLLDNAASVGFVKDGRRLTADTGLDPMSQLKASKADALVVNYANFYDVQLAAMCKRANEMFGLPCEINTYISYLENADASVKVASVAVPLHADSHAVLVFQASGSKRWQVYEPRDPVGYTGFRSNGQTNMDVSRFGVPVTDVVLQTGDVLFIPEGYPHRTLKQQGTSVSHTMGFPSWSFRKILHDRLLKCVGAPAEESLLNLREDVPLGFLSTDNRIRHWVADVSESIKGTPFSVMEKKAYLKLLRAFQKSLRRFIDAVGTLHGQIPVPHDSLRHTLQSNLRDMTGRFERAISPLCVARHDEI
eukprot:TRINITY_DN54425_c0_g1_i1.p1 TRINITY_DN54425_c0_g1~~TRINITY_DN54425_c0_g1_i1.p1  ORF type:complete len:383 (-),score=32.32 TRINITY_DN54425_c0_g1_i1:12-1160(-)